MAKRRPNLIIAAIVALALAIIVVLSLPGRLQPSFLKRHPEIRPPDGARVLTYWRDNVVARKVLRFAPFGLPHYSFVEFHCVLPAGTKAEDALAGLEARLAGEGWSKEAQYNRDEWVDEILARQDLGGRKAPSETADELAVRVQRVRGAVMKILGRGDLELLERANRELADCESWRELGLKSHGEVREASWLTVDVCRFGCRHAYLRDVLRDEDAILVVFSRPLYGESTGVSFYVALFHEEGALHIKAYGDEWWNR